MSSPKAAAKVARRPAIRGAEADQQLHVVAGALHLAEEVGVLHRSVLENVAHLLGPALQRAEVIARDVLSDGEEPGLHAAVALEVAHVLVCSDVSLLRDVLGLLFVGGDAQDVGLERAFGAFEFGGKGGNVEGHSLA